MKNTKGFKALAGMCKYRRPAFDEDHQFIETCRLHIPVGCSWGDCSEEACPILKQWKSANVDAFEGPRDT